ncbi:hypothetical protein BDW68DRAFT_162614 [Aspergillus falconensis]
MAQQPASSAHIKFKPWRQLGVLVPDAWRMYCLRLFDVSRSPRAAIPTPDDGILEALPRDAKERTRLPLIDYLSREEGIERIWTRGVIGERLCRTLSSSQKRIDQLA